MPELRTSGSGAPQDPPGAPPEPVRGMAATRPASPRATSLSIVCDAGQAVHYEGDRQASLWVTRVGSVTIDNPLRPLTPDVTRVLQLVVGNKSATAYGADLLALKRGAAPKALEAVLGGPIRWDPTLPTMPDTLNIVADSGASLAEVPFQGCGQAPVARAAPVAAGRTEAKAAKAQATAPRPAQSAPAPDAAARTRSMTMPKGALPE